MVWVMRTSTRAGRTATDLRSAHDANGWKAPAADRRPHRVHDPGGGRWRRPRPPSWTRPAAPTASTVIERSTPGRTAVRSSVWARRSTTLLVAQNPRGRRRRTGCGRDSRPRTGGAGEGGGAHRHHVVGVGHGVGVDELDGQVGGPERRHVDPVERRRRTSALQLLVEEAAVDGQPGEDPGGRRQRWRAASGRRRSSVWRMALLAGDQLVGIDRALLAQAQEPGLAGRPGTMVKEAPAGVIGGRRRAGWRRRRPAASPRRPPAPVRRRRGRGRSRVAVCTTRPWNQTWTNTSEVGRPRRGPRR